MFFTITWKKYERNWFYFPLKQNASLLLQTITIRANQRAGILTVIVKWHIGKSKTVATWRSPVHNTDEISKKRMRTPEALALLASRNTGQ